MSTDWSLLLPGRQAPKKKAYYLRHGFILPPDTEADLMTYKTPLEKVPGGYGYYGTLAQNKEHTHVQCHICGFFFRGLASHTSMVHGMTGREYKIEHGLLLGPGLTASKQRELHIKHGITSRTPQQKARSLQLLDEYRGRYQPRREHQLELRNRRGRCYYQLLDKIQKLAEKLKQTPSRRDFTAEYGFGDDHAVIGTFGSWNQAVSLAGLTPKAYRPSNPTYSEGMVIAMIRNFYELEGRVPRQSDLGDMLPSGNVIRRLFGGMIGARKAAGLGHADYINEQSSE